MKSTCVQIDKFYLILLVSIMLCGIYNISPTFSLFTDSITIHNTGQILILNINAQSGSSEDIQAAVDWVVANGGIGNVYIPEGDFNFSIPSKNRNKGAYGQGVGVLIPGGVNVIGAGMDKTILRSTGPVEDLGEYVPLFEVDGLNGLQTRISGIGFIGYPILKEDEPWTVGLHIGHATDFRVDHCRFTDFSSKAIIAYNFEPYGVNRGVIDHCSFDNPYKDDQNVVGVGEYGRKVWAYGIIVGGAREWRSMDEYLGKYDGVSDVVYIEDCNFSRTRHAIASNSGAWYVARHNTFTDPRPEHFGIIDVHGDWGGRGLEAYDNDVYGCELFWTDDYEMDYSGTGQWVSMAVFPRAGGGVVYNNRFIDIHYGLYLEEEAPDPPKRLDDLWIWDNDMITQYASPGFTGPDGIYIEPTVFQEGIEYHLSPRPNYTPYPYPHPLTIEP